MEGAFLHWFLVWDAQISNRSGEEEARVPLAVSPNSSEGNNEGGSAMAMMLSSFLAFFRSCAFGMMGFYAFWQKNLITAHSLFYYSNVGERGRLSALLITYLIPMHN